MLKVNKIHQTSLRVFCDDYNSTYEELLASHSDIPIHQKHRKHLAIEVYKSLANFSPKFMQPFFKNIYSLQLKMQIFSFYLLHDWPIAEQTQYNFEVACSRIIFLYQLKSVSAKKCKQKLNHVQKIHCSCVACQRF